VSCSSTNNTNTPNSTNSGVFSGGDTPENEPHEHVDIDPEYLEVTEYDKASALRVCQAGMEAFARPDAAKEDWDAKLAPLMTDDAWEDYSYTDPARVPVSQVGAVSIGQIYTDGRLIDCVAASEAGDYTVTLHRDTQDANWLITGFTPPEELR
jgi:hypothetical protein